MSYYIDIHTHQNKEEDDEVFTLNSLRVSEFGNFPSDNKAYTIGLHPYFSEDISEESWQEFSNLFLSHSDLFWGIGECGLDKRSEVPMDKQIDFFLRQIELAEKLRKPLVLHIVKAWNELLSIRRCLQIKQPWIVHGFRGKPILAKQLLDAGLYLSFGEHYNLESFLLAESYGRAFFETDESVLISIKDAYNLAAQALEIAPEELKERYQQRFLSLS